MYSMREYFIKHLGSECFESREEFKLEISAGDLGVDAIYDPYNDRLKLFNLSARDLHNSDFMDIFTVKSAIDSAYTKLTIYATGNDVDTWHRYGFRYEGSIPGFFRNSGKAMLWARYFDLDRESTPLQKEHSKIVDLARNEKYVKPALRTGYKYGVVDSEDSTEVSRLLRNIFETYPSQITAKWIKEYINSEKNIFRCVRSKDGKIVAVASAEIDHKHSNAELTDCATLPKERSKGHMAYIVHMLEQELKASHNIKCFYSLARASQPGINFVFSRLGFIYTGRLFNNCRMPDGWESMNIWCRMENTG